MYNPLSTFYFDLEGRYLAAAVELGSRQVANYLYKQGVAELADYVASYKKAESTKPSTSSNDLATLLPHDVEAMEWVYGKEKDKSKFVFQGYPANYRELEESINTFAPPPTTINFSRAKKFKITPINGNNGEVIEQWGNSQYDISIEGVLIDMKDHHYPTAAVNSLHKCFEYNGLISVSASVFKEKDIDYIYLTNISFSAVAGYPDTVRYSISARSATEVQLTLKNS